MIIADQAQTRRDVTLMRQADEVTAELRLLSALRDDLMHDRTRAVNRLRAILVHYFPSLEGGFTYATTRGPLVLLTRYATPSTIRRMGESRLASWLKGQGCWKSAAVAKAAIDAAREQTSVVVGEGAAARLVSRSAQDLLRIRDELAELETEIDAVLRGSTPADLLVSIPGFRRKLAADLLAATGADLSVFETPARLSSFAGLAPVPRDSGKISGNHHRPRRYDRRLLNACFQAAFIASTHCPVSRSFYERKRHEGKSHKQALIALARLRINVIWAIFSDQTGYNHTPTQPNDPVALPPQNDSDSPLRSRQAVASAAA